MALLSLLTTPSSYRKLQAEIDSYFSSSTTITTSTSNPPSSEPESTTIIPFATLRKSLPYLQATIREALRLWPPSSGLFTKQVPDVTGDTVNGFYLPPGTEVGQSLVGIGRREEIFGKDAGVFRPERWLEAAALGAAGKEEEMAAAVDLGFSSGKYMCLGKQVALMELGKWLVEVCSFFFFSLPLFSLVFFHSFFLALSFPPHLSHLTFPTSFSPTYLFPCRLSF